MNSVGLGPLGRCRSHATRFLLVLPFAAASVFLYTSGSDAAGPAFQAAGSENNYSWNPGHVETSAGESVSFSNSSSTVPHGVSWTGGPGTPACTGVPIDDGKESWSGTCKFAQAGTYTFVCPVHPSEMKGTIAVGSTAPTPPPGPNPPEAPGSGPIATGLKLAKRQRGAAVLGSMNLLAGGGKLEVELLASRSLVLGTRQSGKMRVGRLVRSAPSAGPVAFAVSLKRVARRALAGREALPLTVTVSVSAPGGATFERKRGVIMENVTSPSKGGTG